MRHIDHQFVDLVPETLSEGVLYVSMVYATVIHKCCCGCGNKVVTPLGPKQWMLTFDGQSISLSPSVGNWNYPCRSHYLICSSNVRWFGTGMRKELNASEKKGPLISLLGFLRNCKRRA